ncbi:MULTISPECIES: asparagine synthase (glutamine-hydrolyzing) [Enterococcus]|uniref:asparagine synthase (glutamine-hydrolyzing) n=1 Tax=Enterococcus alcedinis TaxID=1274384 RepID=A0A917N4G6_9ENTE|nr:asparagine synthase (glutamine-hydrolyzing) [Enterococcus alcedinis]MBP2101888.1 asparagine synthase (glutamine-hydrolyzing) [Enterococcus alcedinis]GGI65451.1 asparagine synthetase B [Enterococcus alcedinis]
MCGIVGFINSQQQKETVIEAMMERIVHRGPNSAGKYVDDQIALGFRRLSVVDLEGGSQPIYNEDRSKVIIFNGEIYNYQRLRDELIQRGHLFTTNSDTEVLLHGYEEWGVDLLQKIRGMFAFAIWDIEKQELFGARDHFGIKPYYYAEMNGTLMFGSEIKSFLPHPDFNKALNTQALKPYLTFQYSPLNGETFFKGVHRLQEGHYFTYKDGKMTIKEYWDADFRQKENLSEKEWVDKIDATVQESIAIHKNADVEVGSFLSSGVDSSYVASILRPEHTFSIGFDDKTYNEAIEARKLTETLGLNNVAAIINGEMSFKAFPLIQYHLDEPDANPSCVPLYFLSNLAAQYVRVVQSGEGADELFAGYNAYGLHTNSKVIRVVAQGLRKLPKGVRYTIGRSLGKMKNFQGRMHLYAATAPAREYFIGHAEIFSETEASSFVTPAFQDAPSIAEIVGPHFDKADQFAHEEVNKMQYLDVHQWMPKDILLKADKLTMASSLESRVPLLDIEMMKLAQSIPTKYLINQNNTKDVFRQASNRHLPEAWANREKLGFPVPIKAWLREDLGYKQVKALFEMDFVREFFDQDKIIQLVEDHHNGTADLQRKIWAVYSFLTWYKVFFIDEEIPKAETIVYDTL